MSSAKNNAVSSDNNMDLESADFVTAYEGVYDYRAFNTTLVMPQIQAVEEREFATLVEQEKFMTDMLVISINKSSDKNAPWVVPAKLNGNGGYFPRGVKIKMPRGLVGVLLQSQEQHFATPQLQDPNADEGYGIATESLPSYPINILFDPRGAVGARWARRILAEGC